MTQIHVNTKQPIAVVFAPKGGLLENLTEGLACHDFSVAEASDLSELASATNKKYLHLGAFVIDITTVKKGGEKALSEYIDCIDPRFRDKGGPVIAIVDGRNRLDEGLLMDLGASKVMDVRLGQRALRLVLSIEIEEFGRLGQLRTELKKRSSAIGQIVKGQFRFKTRREAQNLATMLSMTCPNPMPIAIGLTELFINAVEHGCLDIGHDEKGSFIEDGILAEEIERRRAMPEFCERMVVVNFRREPNRLYFEVKDGGNGFDFASYVADDEGHNKKHGRGIMMAKGCFEVLEYKGNGNEVHAVHFFGAAKDT